MSQKNSPDATDNNHHTTAFMTNGVQTIRFKSKGSKILANIVNFCFFYTQLRARLFFLTFFLLLQHNEAILDRLNNILETFMGISDKELGNFTWHITKW